ncbi:unnamed protein product, partial [Heterotrigona itama]
MRHQRGLGTGARIKKSYLSLEVAPYCYLIIYECSLVYINGREKFHVVVLQPAIKVITVSSHMDHYKIPFQLSEIISARKSTRLEHISEFRSNFYDRKCSLVFIVLHLSRQLTLFVLQMKFAVVLFAAFVAFATVSSHTLPDFGKGPLHEDIQYFLDLIPVDKITGVVLQYAAEDAEFQNLLLYFKTSDFKSMIDEIEAIPEFHKFADYLQNNGVYIYSALNKLNRVIGLPPFHQFSNTQKITGGLKGLFEDVKALVSYDKFIHGYVYKMKTSEAFRGFVAELKSNGNQQFVNALYKNQKFLNFRTKLVQGGLDITLIEDVIYTVLGVEFPNFNKLKMETFASTELSKDIQDFLKL